MPLSDAEVSWLNDFARVSPVLKPAPKADGADGDAAAQPDEAADLLDALRRDYAARREDEEIDEATRKGQLLSQSLGNAMAHADVLRVAFDFEMGSRFNKQKALDAKHGNQEDEIDSADIMKRAKKGEKIKILKDGKEDIAALSHATNAFTLLLKEEGVLRTATTTRSRLNEAKILIEVDVVALFDDTAVMMDYWGALKRARLVSDSMIQNKFSSTKKMLDAVGQYYIDNELANAGPLKGNVKGITKAAANLGGGIASAITSALGVDGALVETLIKAGTTLAEIGMDAGAMALGLEERDVEGLARRVPSLFGDLVDQFTGGMVPGLGGIVAGAGDVAISTISKGAAALKSRGKPITGADVGELFNGYVKVMMQAAVAGAEGSKNPQAIEIVKLMSTAAGAVDFRKAPGIIEGVAKGDYKKVASGVLSMVADMAKVSGKLAQEGAKAANTELSKELGDGLKDGGKIAGEAIALASELLLAKDGAELEAKISGAVPSILGDIASAVGSAAGVDDKTVDALSSQVTASAAATIGMGGLVAKKVKGEPVTAADVTAVLADYIDAAVATGQTVLSGYDGKGAEIAQTQMEAVGGQLSALVKKYGATAEAQLLVNGTAKQRKTATAKLIMMLLLEMPAAGGAIAEAQDGDKAAKAADALGKAADIVEKLQKAGDESAAAFDAADAEVARIEAQLEAERDAALVKDADALVDQVQREREEWQKAVRAGLQPDGDQKAIMKSIAEMKRNEAILKTAIAIGSAGIEVASQFFAPMAAAGQLLKMTAHIGAAVQRAIDLKKMLDGQSYAESGSSAYRSAIDNFVRQQGQQLTEHSIQAAMCALRAASEIAASAHPSAKAASVGVSLAQQGVNLGIMVAKEAELRIAWKVTRDWLGDRENRRAGLKAQRLNPTLAKYAIAYGATEARDPVACKVMNDIGLTNQMLQSEEAGVTLVKTWLEARFSEDQKVAFAWDATEDWQKKLPEPVLTQQNIFVAYAAMARASEPWYDKAPPELAAPPNAMIGSLNRFVEASKTHKASQKASKLARDPARAEAATRAQREKYRDALDAEIAAANDALRLAGIFTPEASAAMKRISGMTKGKGPPGAGFDSFKTALVDVTLAYRTLMDDEAEMLTSDLVTPSLEMVRVQAMLKAMEKKAA